MLTLGVPIENYNTNQSGPTCALPSGAAPAPAPAQSTQSKATSCCRAHRNARRMILMSKPMARQGFEGRRFVVRDKAFERAVGVWRIDRCRIDRDLRCAESPGAPAFPAATGCRTGCVGADCCCKTPGWAAPGFYSTRSSGVYNSFCRGARRRRVPGIVFHLMLRNAACPAASVYSTRHGSRRRRFRSLPCRGTEMYRRAGYGFLRLVRYLNNYAAGP